MSKAPPTLRVVNWSEYQHYKKKNPSWIKLYRSVLTDSDLMRLPVSTRWLAIGLLVLAAETGNAIPNDPEWITWRLRLDGAPDLSALLSIGFIETYGDSRESLEEVYTESIPETEKETETEESSVLSEPGEPDVENSSEWDRLRPELAPLARDLGGEKKVGDWLRWSKANPAYALRVLTGLRSLRERRALFIGPDDWCAPAILHTKYEGQPLERAAEHEYWRTYEQPPTAGGIGRLQVHVGGA